MSALFDARVLKRKIEEALSQDLQEFTESTGLSILGIDLTRVDITSVGEDTRYMYTVDLDIRVLSSQHF